jgi:hypothetical protein
VESKIVTKVINEVQQNLELPFINDLCWINVSKCTQNISDQNIQVTLNQNQYLVSFAYLKIQKHNR